MSPESGSSPTPDFVWPPADDQALMIVPLDATEAPTAAPTSRPASVIAFPRPVLVPPRPAVPRHAVTRPRSKPQFWLLATGAAALVAVELLSPPPVPSGAEAPVADVPVIGRPAHAAGPPLDPPSRPSPPITAVEDRDPPDPMRGRRAARVARHGPAAAPIADVASRPSPHRATAPVARRSAPSGSGETPRFTETVWTTGTVASPLPSVRREPVPIDERLPAIPSPFPVPRGTRATVVVTIDEGGRVVEARLAGETGAYDAPILAAARQWRYRPARVDGQPARATRRVDVTLR